MRTSQSTSATPLLRMGHPMAFIEFLSTIGAPVERHLRRQKLPVLCDDPDVFVPLVKAWAFFGATERHEDPVLGWLVGAHVGDGNLNCGLLRKLVNAPTLLQALQGLVQMASAEASHIQLGIYERPADVLFYTHYSGMRDIPGYLTSQSYQLGVIRGLILHFLGPHWIPEEIGIEHPIAADGVRELFPGSRIRTGQRTGYISVPRACLHQGPPRRAPRSGVADDLVLSKDFDYIDRLRAVLKAYLPDGYPSARFTAELVDVSERTLARRLAAHGLTYGKLIDDVRFLEAKKLLLKPGMGTQEVAMSVGFDDQSNFTRMFRRIGGLTPREFRKATLH